MKQPERLPASFRRVCAIRLSESAFVVTRDYRVQYRVDGIDARKLVGERFPR
jgi:hypothetical protein